MTTVIAQRQLRNDNAAIIDAVVGGEDFVVTRNGEPVARLTPVRPERRRFISRAHVQELARSAIRIDRAAFRDDLDGTLDPDLTR